MNEDDLRELKAYKMGYDLGWFRANEALKPLLDQLQSCISHSHTWQEIENDCEKEGRERPLFMAKIIGIIADMEQLRRETMPALVIEQKSINDMGKRLETLSKEDWDKLSMKDDANLYLKERR